jgi:hypothetical protein
MTTRRNILFGLGGATLGAAAAKAADLISPLSKKAQTSLSTPDTAAPQAKDYTLKGKLFALGANGTLHPTGMENDLQTGFGGAVLSEIDMATGATKQTWLPMHGAHHALPNDNGEVVCIAHHGPVSLVVDEDHKVKHQFISEEGYVYGGHGQALPEKGVFILPVRYARAMSVKDTGRFEIYDLKTFKLLDKLDTGGIHPHEIRMLPSKKELVVTHYGEVIEKNPSNPMELNIVEPKLSVYDADTLKPIRHYVQDINAILTHMDIGPEGHVFAVMNQYIRMHTPEDRARAMAVLRLVLGKPDIDIEFHEDAIRRKRISIPLPTLKINPLNGDVEEIFVGNEQNRAQSVATNTLTGTVFATYLYTNTVLVIPHNKPAFPLNMAKFGIDTVRGIADIPGTPYMAVGSSYRGMAVIDTRNFELVKYFNHQVFVSPHMSTYGTV